VDKRTIHQDWRIANLVRKRPANANVGAFRYGFTERSAKSDSGWGRRTKEIVIPDLMRRLIPNAGGRRVIEPALLVLPPEREFWGSGRPPNSHS